MLPQSIREEGGYKLKGKTPEAADALLADALAIENAGAFAVVLELVKADVAQRISATLTIPTIGIGAGAGCDGQVLVTHDLIGLFPWFTPKFARQHAQVAASIREAATAFLHETKNDLGDRST
jgi:3-methyl-2-oxobutanoate hydroxymethyltransferase